MKIKKVLVFVLFLNILLIANPTKEEVTKLYVATFDRAPDSIGLNYWVNESGLSLKGIAQSFFEQDETKEKYPEGTTNEYFVSKLYENLFDREADEEGLNYWEDELSKGSLTRDKLILAMINGAQDNQNGYDLKVLENKTSIGLEFAQNGFDDKDEASFVLSKVNASPNSILYAQGQLNRLKDDIVFLNSLKEEDLVDKSIYFNDNIVVELYKDRTAVLKNLNYNSHFSPFFEERKNDEGNWRLLNGKIIIEDKDNSFFYEIMIDSDLNRGNIISLNDENYVINYVSDLLYKTDYETHNLKSDESTSYRLNSGLSNDGTNIVYSDGSNIKKYILLSRNLEDIQLDYILGRPYFTTINGLELVNNSLYVSYGSFEGYANIIEYNYSTGEYISEESDIYDSHSTVGLSFFDSFLYSVREYQDARIDVKFNIETRESSGTFISVGEIKSIASYNDYIYILGASGEIYKFNPKNNNLDMIYVNSRIKGYNNIHRITILDGKLWILGDFPGSLAKLNIDLE